MRIYRLVAFAGLLIVPGLARAQAVPPRGTDAGSPVVGTTGPVYVPDAPLRIPQASPAVQPGDNHPSPRQGHGRGNRHAGLGASSDGQDGAPPYSS